MNLRKLTKYFFSGFRKRSPKSKDDGFLFPEIKASDKCDLEIMAKPDIQKPTTSVPQHHTFAEPKPKVSAA